MVDFNYFNKRDNNKLLLSFSAHELAANISKYCLNKIKDYNIYKILINAFPGPYVTMYFKELFYRDFLPIAHQIVIYKWHVNQTGKRYKKSISIQGFLSKELLSLVWFDKIIPFTYKPRHKDLKRGIKDILRSHNHKVIKARYFLRSRFSSKVQKRTENFSQNSEGIIAVNYVEGINRNKRSDLFWLHDSGVDPSSVLVYFENKKKMGRYEDTDKVISKLDDIGVKWIKLWEWNDLQPVAVFTALQRQMRNNQPADHIERRIYKESKYLLSMVKYWYSFFKYMNVKIHYNSSESGSSPIVKQIALNLLGGCSLGKLRSYPTKHKGTFFGNYPNDIFFTWGHDGSERLAFTENNINQILISGYPYGKQSFETKNKLNNIKEQLCSSGAKSVLLLLDSNQSENKGLVQHQCISTPVLEEFYRSILNLVITDDEFGLIIKSKKPSVLAGLHDVNNLIEKAVSTGRCYKVEDMFQTKPFDIASIADMAVAIQHTLSSSLIESVINGIRGVFYDYGNLRSIETDLYAWGDRKVMFTDLSEMIAALKAYKSDPANNPGLGDWSEHLDELDPFRDGRGGERIGTYTRWLQGGFEEGLERDATIAQANRRYAGMWGEDKVFFTEQPLKAPAP